MPLGIGAQRKPSAECILMVVSLPPPRGYRFSEAAAALERGRSSSAPVYCVGFDANPKEESLNLRRELES